MDARYDPGRQCIDHPDLYRSNDSSGTPNEATYYYFSAVNFVSLGRSDPLHGLFNQVEGSVQKDPGPQEFDAPCDVASSSQAPSFTDCRRTPKEDEFDGILHFLQRNILRRFFQ